MRAFFCGLPLETGAASAPNTFWKAPVPWLRSSSRSQTKSARLSWPASAMRLSRLTAMKVLPAPVASESSARFSPRASFSEHGADGGVLVVAARRLAARVAREEWARFGRLQAEAHGLLVPGAQVGGRRELGERRGLAS